MRIRVGGFPELTVDAARTEAAKLIGQMAKGENPAQQRRQKRQEATLGDLWEHWLNNHAKLHKKTWDEDERIYNAHLKPWANRKLSSIGKHDVQGLHNKIGKDHPYQANRILALVRAMFNRADEIGYAGLNPTKGVKKFAEKSRDRFIKPDELPAFFTAVAEEPNELLRDFMLLALFTGARRSNVQAMRWDEIDLARAEWRIPDTKAGRPQVVYLSEPALRVLLRRREFANGDEYVLPGRGRQGHVTDVKSAWKRITTAAGLKDLRVHDLRRTLGSYQAIQGASLAIIGASLGHSQPTTTQVYARLTTNAVAESVAKAGALLDAAMEASGKRSKKKGET